MIRLIPPERFDEVQRELQAELASRTPEVVNLEPALALVEPAPLVWDGREYPVRAIGVPEGFQLQRYRLHIERMAQATFTTPEDLDELEGLYYEITDYLWGLLDPKPHENPFALAEAKEVGQLLAFFWMRRTTQSARSPSRLTIPPRGMSSTASSSSRTTTPH